ncbi:MAG: biopolymer transporter ExbD [Pseudomonadota bacterium]
MSRLAAHRRRARGGKKTAGLNLVSLMDIFTILVFFLMVNSSEVEVLQTSSDIKLPDSNSEQQPQNNIVVSVGASDIIVQGRAVARIADLTGDEQPVIDGLQTELEYQASRRTEMPEGGFEITVMGDKAVPYWLLKRILYTCQTTDFARVSLAVNKINGPTTPEELLGDPAQTAAVGSAAGGAS